MPLALAGIGISKGIAIGKARILQRGQLEVLECVLPVELIGDEVARYNNAVGLAREQLRSIKSRIPESTPRDIAAFIDTHLLMLDDAALATAPIELIRSQHCNAEWALKLQQDALIKVFDTMDDPYLKTRRDDVEHVVNRIQHILMREEAAHEPHGAEADGPLVFLATDISPADLMLLHHQSIAALVTERGGPLSHTAILARSLGIPAIAGVHHAYQYVREDEQLVVDGNQGVLLAGLGPADIAYYRKRQNAERTARARLRSLKETPSITQDGVAIGLHANIELEEDISTMRRAGADGVGLYRTEFLFMNRAAPPDEEEQFQIYRRTIKRIKGAPLTIRTLDLGADKQAIPGNCAARNPALGLRAIRLCLKELDLFRTQLRAIMRASAYGPVRILIPMLTHLGEVFQVKRLVQETAQTLKAEGRRFDPVIPLGGMIEVPAAALCADGFCRELDFLSIGTNDLIQYTLATDRIDDEVNYLYNPLHPAVLRLIRNTLQAGERARKPVSMCGEMAGDPDLTRLLLGMGLTEFSMPPSALLAVKQVIIGSDASSLRRRVNRLFQCHHPDQVLDLLAAINRD